MNFVRLKGGYDFQKAVLCVVKQGERLFDEYLLLEQLKNWRLARPPILDCR